MVKYCGYLVADAWLLQRGITELGYDQPTTNADKRDIILEASRDVRMQTGVLPYSRLRRVRGKDRKKTSWCIALASTDPLEGLPTSRPPEETYIALKELLQKKAHPLWFRAT